MIVQMKDYARRARQADEEMARRIALHDTIVSAICGALVVLAFASCVYHGLPLLVSAVLG